MQNFYCIWKWGKESLVGALSCELLQDFHYQSGLRCLCFTKSSMQDALPQDWLPGGHKEVTFKHMWEGRHNQTDRKTGTARGRKCYQSCLGTGKTSRSNCPHSDSCSEQKSNKLLMDVQEHQVFVLPFVQPIIFYICTIRLSSVVWNGGFYVVWMKRPFEKRKKTHNGSREDF